MTTHGGALLTSSFAATLAPVTYKAFRPCLVDANNQFLDWVPGTAWTFLPAGIAILEADMDKGSPGALPDDGAITRVDHVPLPVGDPQGDLNGNGVLEVDDTGAGSHGDLAHDVRSVVFKPSGRLPSLQCFVTLGEAEHDGSSWVMLRNRRNLVDICIDQYTGRIVVRSP